MKREMEGYIFSGELEKRRPGTPNSKNWQMVQSSDTEAENLEHDFTEIVAKVQELGWRDGKRLSKKRKEKFVKRYRVLNVRAGQDKCA